MMVCMAARTRRRRDVLSPEAVELIAERFRILQELENGERNVSELVAAVGSSQPNVSKHLRILQESGVVGRRQEGNNVYYAIADPAVIDLCDAVCSSVRERLTSAAKLAAELGRR